MERSPYYLQNCWYIKIDILSVGNKISLINTFENVFYFQIIDRKTYRENCSGHGRYLLGRCRCDLFYHGAKCQYKEECMDDSDCGTQGACIDNGGTTPPTKYCYCNVGWFGSGCSKSKFQKL